MEKSIVPVLLAGGIGSRLWPLSREHYPKQLLSLLGDDSLLQSSLRRILKLPSIKHFIVICNEEHRFEVLSQIDEINPGIEFTIMLEPEGRNTAPAAALAAFSRTNNDLLMLLPADHMLSSEDEFIQQISLASTIASQGKLITFGIKPTHAETGYGYIEVGQKNSDESFTINQFVEKPDSDTAQRFVDCGTYFWNSGMFLFSRDVLLEELEAHANDIFQAMSLLKTSFVSDGPFLRVAAEQFSNVPSRSIDYAIMEKTTNAHMLPLQSAWSDIGSWQSLYTFENKNDKETVVIGDVIDIDNESCYLRSESHLLAAIGLKNIVVVQTADCVLVADINESQRVKDIVSQLQHQGRSEALSHLTQFHPWGKSTLLNRDNQIMIKQVDIKVGKALSLHSHQSTTESWQVISGKVQVLCDDKTYDYESGDAFFIDKNVRHKIMNIGNSLLKLVEVRSGEHDSEEDIERYD